jgi:hypothetical protein
MIRRLEDWSWSGRTSVAVLIVAMFLATASVAVAVGQAVDPSATLAPGRHQMSVSGTGQSCPPGDQFSVRAAVKQARRVASGRAAGARPTAVLVGEHVGRSDPRVDRPL